MFQMDGERSSPVQGGDMLDRVRCKPGVGFREKKGSSLRQASRRPAFAIKAGLFLKGNYTTCLGWGYKGSSGSPVITTNYYRSNAISATG
jgi:hypothetical protein